MNMAAEEWDKAVESALQKANTTTSEPVPGLKPLRHEPVVSTRHLPEQRRSISAIDPTLRENMRGCVIGELPWPLFITGPAGVGKTSAALCLLDYAGGVYHTANGLCSVLVQSQQGRLEWYDLGQGGTLWPEEFWRRLRRTPLVVLDEMGGRDRVSDHHYESVKQALDERAGKPLVAISNLSLAEIGRLYDDRIASRLAVGTVVVLTGKDRRMRRA